VSTSRRVFRLRAYQPEDFETLHEIDHQCFDAAIAYSRFDLRSYLRLPGADCVIAEVAGKIAGFLVTAHENSVGAIVTVDVLPVYRRQGVATLLLTEAERRLAAGGTRVIELETATDNASAIAFWKKHGYRTEGVKKQYYPDGRDAFTMTKQLPVGHAISE
jgi:[ribosomal protein S18]-alanine N-acetyltransferase